jgi:PAS domain S-box-containing protein
MRKQKKDNTKIFEIYEGFRPFFMSHPDSIYILNKEGKIIDLNPTAIKKSNYKRDEIINIPIEKLFTSHSQNILSEEFPKLIKKGHFNLELELLSKKGQIINVDCLATVLKNNKKKIERIILFAHDITKLKQTEDALVFESRLLNSLFENIPDSIYFKDRESRFIKVSKAKADKLGHSIEELIGKTDFDFHPEEEAKEEYEDEQRIIKSKIPIINKEEKVINPDGTIWWASTTKVPRYDESGNVVGTLGISRNITDRIQAEKRLKETANKFQAIVNSVSEGLAIVDSDLKIKEINKYLLWLFEIKRKNIINKKCYDVFKCNKDICNNCPIKYTFKNGTVNRTEMSEVSKEGSIKYYDIQSHPIIDDEGNIIQVVISVRDITKRKHAEEEKILNYQRKLRNLSHKLILAEEHERKRIATTLHGEIGQSLAFIKLSIGELKKIKMPHQVAQSIKEIYNLVQQAITATRSLMHQISPTILYELGFVPAVDWLTERILEKNGIYCKFTKDIKKMPLNDDICILLFQAVQELLINIRKHAQAKKTDISVKRENSNILITVSDNGIGFDTSKLDSYTDENIGFGLLNIRERLNMIGGTFEIESMPGKGTTVTLRAPLEIKNKNKAVR